MNDVKKLFAWSSFLLLGLLSIAAMVGGDKPFKTFDNELLKERRKAAGLWLEKHQDERVYVALDKTLYAPGEDIWFSAFVRDETSMKATSTSGLIRVELINPKGNSEKKIKLVLRNGQANGDFHLDKNAPGGLYTIKAYTNWQKNELASLLFEQEVQVQGTVLPKLKMQLDFEKTAYGPGDKVIAHIKLERNDNTLLLFQSLDFVITINGIRSQKLSTRTDKQGQADLEFTLPQELHTAKGLVNVLIPFEGSRESISRSIPIVLNQIELSFYPEGGELVGGLRNRVAFAALNEFGKGADISGEIVNNSGDVVAQFSSFHQGKGAFEIKPSLTDEYKARITQPAGIEKLYSLPAVKSSGLALKVTNENRDHITVTLGSKINQEVSLVGMVRGKVYWTGAVSCKKGESLVHIPTKDLPMGVLKLTAIDGQEVEQAERLVFVGYKKGLNIELSTDKDGYQPGEKVKVSVVTKDDLGNPVNARLAISVVDDQLLSFSNDKSGKLLSKMFLEPELKGTVEDAGFYFNKKEPKAEMALDFLLLTRGWRKFEWKRIQQNIQTKSTFEPEKAVVSGRVLDMYSRQPVKGVRIEFVDLNKAKISGENGSFDFGFIDLTLSTKILLSAPGYDSLESVLSSYGNGKELLIQKTGSAPKFNVMIAANAPMKGMGDVAVARRFKAEVLMDDAEMEEQAQEDDLQVELIANVEAKDLEEIDRVGERELVEVDEPEFNKMFMGKARKLGIQEDVNPLDRDGFKLYRARFFAGPSGREQKDLKQRNDFKTTVFWQGDVETGSTGSTEFSFYNNDKVGSFRIIAQGFADLGLGGQSRLKYFSQLPFNVQFKTPLEVSMGDDIIVQLVLKNNLKKLIDGTVYVSAENGLKLEGKSTQKLSVAAGQVTVVNVPISVLNQLGEGVLSVSFDSKEFKDGLTKKIKIGKKGFPASISFNAQELENSHSLVINSPVDGSIQCDLVAYPTLLSDILEGLEGILREPYGCFEQASSSTYPNIMVMQYLREANNINPAVASKALDLIDRGYKRLTTYETSEKGYEWFGSTPSHEALTAYGLMEFHDMSKVYGKVDPAMIKRTKDYLISRKDGAGGFKRSSQALDAFGRASQEVTDAYIFWALSEAGEAEIGKEYAAVVKTALKQKDPYLLALSANTAFNLGQVSDGDKLLDALAPQQLADGSFEGKQGTITMSGGLGLKVETTALSIMGFLKSKNPDKFILKSGVKAILNSRSHGSFGATQSTVLALKALIAYTKFSKRTEASGTIAVYINEKKAMVRNYEKGHQGSIDLDGLGPFLKKGKNEVEVKYISTDQALPYTLNVDWNTTLPNSSEACMLEIESVLQRKSVNVGETVALNTKVLSESDLGLPMTLVKIGIPAGTTVQPWQLKELQEKGVFDYYELTGNHVICYFRDLKPREGIDIQLDLKAQTSGVYQAPASCAYLYYTNELKDWTQSSEITIQP